MSLFISEAWAEGAAAGGSPEAGLLNLLFPLLLIAIFYFVLLRPQMKRAKEHKKMVEAIQKQDEVVTNGGMLGKVTKVGDSFISVEIADGIEVKVQRSAVASVLPKGTLKSA